MSLHSIPDIDVDIDYEIDVPTLTKKVPMPMFDKVKHRWKMLPTNKKLVVVFLVCVFFVVLTNVAA